MWTSFLATRRWVSHDMEVYIKEGISSYQPMSSCNTYHLLYSSCCVLDVVSSLGGVRWEIAHRFEWTNNSSVFVFIVYFFNYTCRIVISPQMHLYSSTNCTHCESNTTQIACRLGHKQPLTSAFENNVLSHRGLRSTLYSIRVVGTRYRLAVWVWGVWLVLRVRPVKLKLYFWIS